MNKESGQVLLALILIMSVALAIGLSIIQKSLVDVSSSTRSEESSRAYSAAEAGIERVLSGGSTSVDFTSDNQSTATVTDEPNLPQTASAGSQQKGFEYASITKEDFVHIWLADPSSAANPPAEFYKPTSGSIEVYWGNSTTDKAAIEVRIVYFNGSTFELVSPVSYFDPDPTRASNNGFTNVSVSCDPAAPHIIDTILGAGRNFLCKQVISGLPSNLMLMRIRLLYNSTGQPVAVRASGTCGPACSLPPQGRIITSYGVSGKTQRVLKLFQEDKVVPNYFDYAIFSAGAITK